ncbi:hypothetical protein CK203_108917 [Vitis vinifera]|uniref:Uncharacterized protein n=1 Tax=Vitis vinifera TaxID=29760 RepID=A0A438DGY7_VITVI|nr:hypothetical protein CK203_108917 [Vitis vinifera]
MCGGDDHLAWKRPVFSEACKGLRTTGGSMDTVDLGSASWISVRGRLIKVSDQVRLRLPHRRHGVVSTSKDAHAHMDRLEQRMR